MQRPLKLALFAVALLAPLSALASDGYVNGYVNLRAGPGTRYPRIMTLQPGTAVAVHGCINGWSWCDVGAQGERGWIDGSYLQYPYGNRRVALSNYGSQIGIPIVSFILGTYWGDHYRDRSWYGERQRWADSQYGYGQRGRGYRPQRGYYPAQQGDQRHDHGGDHGGGHDQGGGHGHDGRQSPSRADQGHGHDGHKPPPGNNDGGGGGGG